MRIYIPQIYRNWLPCPEKDAAGVSLLCLLGKQIFSFFCKNASIYTGRSRTESLLGVLGILLCSSFFCHNARPIQYGCGKWFGPQNNGFILNHGFGTAFGLENWKKAKFLTIKDVEISVGSSGRQGPIEGQTGILVGE